MSHIVSPRYPGFALPSVGKISGRVHAVKPHKDRGFSRLDKLSVRRLLDLIELFSGDLVGVARIFSLPCGDVMRGLVLPSHVDALHWLAFDPIPGPVTPSKLYERALISEQMRQTAEHHPELFPEPVEDWSI